MRACSDAGTRPASTNDSVPRLTAPCVARTSTSSGFRAGSASCCSSHWPPWGPLYNENLKGFDEQLKSALEEARSKGEDVTQEEAERHLAALVGGFDGLKERFVKAFGADWRVEVILVNILDPHKWCDDAGQACSSSSSA